MPETDLAKVVAAVGLALDATGAVLALVPDLLRPDMWAQIQRRDSLRVKSAAEFPESRRIRVVGVALLVAGFGLQGVALII